MVDMNDRDVVAAMYVLLLARAKKDLFDSHVDYSEICRQAEMMVESEITDMANEIKAEIHKHSARAREAA